VIGHGTGTEDRAANDHAERECDDDVSRRVEIDVDRGGSVQAQSRTHGAQRQGDAHCQRGRDASGKDDDADDENEQDPEADRLRPNQPGGVNRHDDEHQRRHDDGQCRQQRFADSLAGACQGLHIQVQHAGLPAGWVDPV
jgi:hypothetical protein